ncbi:MAG: PorV/PorQ family protein, partial [Elusimicrobia bacterium]|nr:PorV/PorQ family protein [Elusimicrobiota bacterium]
AYSAVVNNAEALAWNPAALNEVRSRSATFSHAAYIDSSFFDFAAYAQNLDRETIDGAIGAALLHFSPGRVTERDASGNEVGRFSPNDTAMMLGYALEYRRFSFGGAWKLVNSTLKKTTRTTSFDFGVLTPFAWEDRLRAAVTLANIGGHLQFDREGAALPFVIRLGSMARLPPHWIASLDLAFPKDSDPYGAVGMEYVFLMVSGWNTALRAGFNSLTLEDVDGLTGVSLGFGAQSRKYAIDYGIVPLGDLALTHRLSLSLLF